MTLAIAGLAILGAYLFGAVPFGFLVARARGVDIFQQGSGNIGATNVGRVLGRRFGILVFVLDFSKGALPAALTGLLSLDWIEGFGNDELQVACGLAAFLGHMYPVYLRFRGGKGVATGAGVVAVLLPLPALGGLLAWVVAVTATRYVSLGSILAAAALCLFRLTLVSLPFDPANRTLTLFSLFVASLVIVKHRANIQRLLQGNESRLRDSPTMLLLSKTIHVLSLGLWFGTALFSFVVAFVIFHTFESLAKAPNPDRPSWLPLDENPDEKRGTRLAGLAIGPIFPWYFLIQGVCGFLAVATALGWSWSEPGNTVHKVRSVILIMALAGVVIGWPLAKKVSELRVARYAFDPAVAESAKAAFGTMHLYSLLLNLVTILLVTAAMVLAAQMPVKSPESGVKNQESESGAPA